eukprot:5584502-Prymnesium_polylepis.1
MSHVHVGIPHIWHVSHWHRGHAGTHPMTHRPTLRACGSCVCAVRYAMAGGGARHAGALSHYQKTEHR